MAGDKEREHEIRRRLSSLFTGMMKSLFNEKGSRFRVELVADPAVQRFVGAHASVLDSTFEKVGMTDAMRRRLTRSNYIFSGMKAFHELHEAFPSLLDENGNRKSFERFLNDVQSIDATYNVNYLRAEYNFVAASAEMAARWEQFMADGDRYNLQYRTQADDKVRPEHAALDRVTLPPSDSFWEQFYPPNGWNCFVGHTPVLTSEGWKFIKDIREGDLVVGGSGEYRKVIATLSRPVNAELVRVFTKGALATCTENHRFLTSRGWIAAADLKPFDILVQVGEISPMGKFVNAIHNSLTLLKYLAVSIGRKREPVAPEAVDGDTDGRQVEINDELPENLALLEWHSRCLKVMSESGLSSAFGLYDGTHPFWMKMSGLNRIGNRLCPAFSPVERGSRLKFLRNALYKGAVGLVLPLSHMFPGQGKRAVDTCKVTSGGSPASGVVDPLSPDGIGTVTDRDIEVHKDSADGAPVDMPVGGKPSETSLLDKVTRFGGIRCPATFNGFDSLYDFLRQTFLHTRYAFVRRKDNTSKSIVKVYNLSVQDDESYVVPSGIVHNCRCTVVQVRKSKYPVTPHDEAMRLGDEALQRDSKGIFRFNPGIERKSVPDYNPYTIRKCSTCPIAKGGKSKKLAAFIPDNEVCKACVLIHQCEQLRGEIIRHGSGTIEISHLVNRSDSDFQRLLSVAKYFAADGAKVVLTPKMTRPPKFEYDCVYGDLRGTRYDGKCPDLKIGNYWYEHEGFSTNNPKRAFSNMINHGMKQSDRIIIDKPDLTDAYMKRIINQRILDGHYITEIWLNENGKLRLLYKKSEE